MVLRIINAHDDAANLPVVCGNTTAQGDAMCLPTPSAGSVHRTSAMIGAFWRACRDFLGPAALLTLGRRQYLRLASTYLNAMPQILSTRTFGSVYKAMGSRPVRIRFKGGSFLIDCPYADEQIHFGTHSFILIRELFIRNCYIRDAVARAFPRVRTVLDLGANRGLFSTMMAGRVDKVVAVEVMPRYVDVIRRNMGANGYSNCTIETAFVGAGGTAATLTEAGNTRTISEILDRHHMPAVDLVKMDIEGSEFALFEKPDWLDRVSALCMEVHPDCGNVTTILGALACHGFHFTMRDRTLKTVADPQEAMYIYAAR
jgi:hypothetical protein